MSKENFMARQKKKKKIEERASILISSLWKKKKKGKGMVYLWSVMLPIGDCLYSLMLTRVALYRKLLRYKTRRKRRVGKPLNATAKQIMLEVNLCNLNALKLKENCTEY